jgi:hypothetical protein
MGDPILSDSEVALLAALVQSVPRIGQWIEGIFVGDERATRHVSDILPERSASQEAAEELRRG